MGVIILETVDSDDGHVIEVCADWGHIAVTSVKGHQREVMLLGVAKVFLCLLDGGDSLGDATDGHLFQPTHRAALVDDDEVVDLCLLGVYLPVGRPAAVLMTVLGTAVVVVLTCLLILSHDFLKRIPHNLDF